MEAMSPIFPLALVIFGRPLRQSHRWPNFGIAIFAYLTFYQLIRSLIMLLFRPTY